MKNDKLNKEQNVDSEKLWLIDAHCDSLWMRDFWHDKLELNSTSYPISSAARRFFQQKLQFDFGADYVQSYHITLSRLRQGNVRVLFLNLGDYDLLQSSRLIDAAHILTQNGDFAICTNSNEINNALSLNKIAIIISAEGPCLFNGQIDLLRNWYRLGLRVVNLSHGEGVCGIPIGVQKYFGIKRSQALAKHALQVSASLDNYITPQKRQKLYEQEDGITTFGREVIQEMTGLNMLCDLSHANDAAFWEVLDTKVKVCVTHSNCFSVCNHSRNLTDEMMRALAKRNGVMGICFYGEYLDKNKPSLDKLVEHILHALDIMGEDHVGIGSDYDGVPPGSYMALKHPGFISKLWEKLASNGISELVLQKIAHKNFLRVFTD